MVRTSTNVDPAVSALTSVVDNHTTSFSISLLKHVATVIRMSSQLVSLLKVLMKLSNRHLVLLNLRMEEFMSSLTVSSVQPLVDVVKFVQ